MSDDDYANVSQTSADVDGNISGTSAVDDDCVSQKPNNDNFGASLVRKLTKDKHECECLSHDNKPPFDESMSLSEIEALSVRYPRYIREEEFLTSLSNLLKEASSRHGMEGAYEDIFSYIKDDELEDDDPFRLRRSHVTLVLYWEMILASLIQRERNTAVQGLLYFAFEIRLGGKHTYRMQTTLALSDDPWTTQADAVASMNLPRAWNMFLRRQAEPLVVCPLVGHDLGDLPVITFAFESNLDIKNFSNCARKLTKDLTSAQHQRRSIGFKDGPVFGALLFESHLSIYVSKWHGDRIAHHNTGVHFVLDDPAQFIRCYLFMCNLSEYVARQMNDEITRWQDESERELMKNRVREALR